MSENTSEETALPLAATYKPGDRVSIIIAPDVVGVITETLDNGWVLFQADGQDTAHEFHPGSFKPAK